MKRKSAPADGLAITAEGRPWGTRAGALAACAAIFLATAAAYLPAIRAGFIWDDDGHVTRPPLRSLHGLWRIWFQVGATQQYYPVLHSAFWLEHRLWGDAPLGYHLLNVLLHATAACLFVAVLRRLAVPGPWLGGLLFALHPVCVESVAWVSEQKNTLSAVFYLLSALAYLKWREIAGPAFDRREGPAAPRDGGRMLPIRRGLYVLATGLFVLATLTKSVTATLPAALLVVAWWRRGRLSWREDVAPLLPWFALGAACGLLTAWVEWKYVGAKGSEFGLNGVERCLLAGRAAWFYLGKLVWPSKLIFIYPRWVVSSRVWWQYLFPAAALALAGALWRVSRGGRRGPLAAFLYFCGTLFPALGFFNVYPFVFSYVADHFQYLASLGGMALAGPLLLAGPSLPADRGPQRGPFRLCLATAANGRILRAGLAAAVVCILGALTWRQCGVYRDIWTLYASTLEQNPECVMAHNNLAMLLADEPGRQDDAIAHYEAALRIKPDYADAHNNLATLLARLPGRQDDAIAHYEAALRIDPNYADAHYNFANLLARLPGRQADAIAHLETALRLRPDYAEAHNNLANLLARQPGRRADAIVHYEAALGLRPGYAEAHNNLALLFAADPGRQDDAVAHFETALRLRPDYAEAHNNLANLLADEPDRQADAIAHYEAALRLRPDFAEAHNNLALLLAGQPGRQADAIAHFEAALRLRPDSYLIHFNLARVLETFPDRQEEAALHFSAALKINPDFAPAREALRQLQDNAR